MLRNAESKRAKCVPSLETSTKPSSRKTSVAKAVLVDGEVPTVPVGDGRAEGERHGAAVSERQDGEGAGAGRPQGLARHHVLGLGHAGAGQVTIDPGRPPDDPRIVVRDRRRRRVRRRGRIGGADVVDGVERRLNAAGGRGPGEDAREARRPREAERAPGLKDRGRGRSVRGKQGDLDGRAVGDDEFQYFVAGDDREIRRERDWTGADLAGVGRRGASSGPASGVGVVASLGTAASLGTPTSPGTAPSPTAGRAALLPQAAAATLRLAIATSRPTRFPCGIGALILGRPAVIC